MSKKKALSKGHYLTHLTPKGKRKLVMKMANLERARTGVSQSVALRRTWKDLRERGFLD